MKKSTVFAAIAVCSTFWSVYGANQPAGYAHVFRPESARTQQSLKAAGVLNLGYALPGDKKSSPATCTVVNVPGRTQPVMRLVSHGDAKILPGSQFAKFRLLDDPRNFNKIKMGMEFCLNDKTDKTQLLVNAVVGANAKSAGYVACVRFASDRIEVLMPRPNRPSSIFFQQFPCDLGTGKFHAIRIQADAGTRTVSVFREGDAKPLATATMPDGKDYAVAINFGDGAGDLFGSADIAYFAWQLEK